MDKRTALGRTHSLIPQNVNDMWGAGDPQALSNIEIGDGCTDLLTYPFYRWGEINGVDKPIYAIVPDSTIPHGGVFMCDDPDGSAITTHAPDLV